MDAQHFLSEFGHIANAPGGIKYLRELIYQFAVTGRLVSQQFQDGDANALLSDVARIRQQRIAEKRLKRAPKLESEQLKIPSINLPPNWRWSRLLDIGEVNPRNLAVDKAKATFVPMSAVSAGHGKPIGGEQAIWRDISKGYTHFANGDVIIAKITPCFENGKAAVVTGLVNGIGSGSTEFHVFRPISDEINPAYIYLFLRSPLFRIKGQSKMTGTAGQKRLPMDYFALCAVPLPPKAEQDRIVDKVDELMFLCENLEAQQHNRRKLQNSLRKASMQAITDAQRPIELQDSWSRLEANFGRVFSEPSDVAELRSLILNMAANGYLSEPNTDDDDPKKILDEAIAEQIRVFSTREQHEVNALPAPHYVKGRLRVTLGHVIKLVSGQHLSPGQYNLRQTGIPYITGPAEFKNRRPAPTKWTTERRALARAGDILITVKGSGVGKAAICDLEELAISRQLMAIRALSNIDPGYLSICVDYAEKRFQSQKFGIAIPGIGRDEVLRLEIILPSIQEQKRIVARVFDLMSICDDIEAHLRNSVRVATRLVIASVSALTGITIGQEEESTVKAPQTELMAPLRLGTPPDVKAQAPLVTILVRHDGQMSARDLWQRFGGPIDAFYAQLKSEVAFGWIAEPELAEVKEKFAEVRES